MGNKNSKRRASPPSSERNSLSSTLEKEEGLATTSRSGKYAETEAVTQILSNLSRGKDKEKANLVMGDFIGTGAYGTVHQAYDHSTGKILAVKKVTAVTVTQAKALQREVLTLRALKHPHIVQYMGCEYENGELCIMMEYVPGGSVSSIVKKYGPLQEDVIRKYISQVLAGLNFLHEKGIIHRDIKGGNLLITQSGRVKLADFGCAAAEEEKQRGMTGTISWMAPECAVDDKPATVAADIWSVGACIVEMLTGKPPYGNMSPIQALHLMKKEMPTIPENCSTELRDFLMRCLCRDPAKRGMCKELIKHPFLQSSASLDNSTEVPEISNKSMQGRQRRSSKLLFTYKKPAETPLSRSMPNFSSLR